MASFTHFEFLQTTWIMWVQIPENFHRLRLSLFISPLRSPSLSRSLDFCSVFRASRRNNWTCCGQCRKNVFISTCQEKYVQMHWTSHHSTNIENPGIASCKEIQIPGNFSLWNLESWTLESGIQLKESGIPSTIEIPNPSPTEKESRIEYLESGIHGVESRIQTCLGFSYIGRQELLVQWSSNCLSRNPFVTSQGSYRSWKSWKVMEFKTFIFKSCNVVEFQLSVLDSHWKLKFCLVD